MQLPNLQCQCPEVRQDLSLALPTFPPSFPPFYSPFLAHSVLLFFLFPPKDIYLVYSLLRMLDVFKMLQRALWN